jgi:hypothetical protein
MAPREPIPLQLQPGAGTPDEGDDPSDEA